MVIVNLAENLKECILLRFKELKTPYLILYLVGFNSAIAFIFFLIRFEFVYIIHSNFLPFDSLAEEIFMVLLLGPIIETGLYQYAIIDLTILFTKFVFKKELIVVAILLSAICYSLSHSFDYLYMAQMVIAGSTYSIFYIVTKQKNINAFIYTVILHSLCNLSLFGLKHF